MTDDDAAALMRNDPRCTLPVRAIDVDRAWSIGQRIGATRTRPMLCGEAWPHEFADGAEVRVVRDPATGLVVILPRATS